MNLSKNMDVNTGKSAAIKVLNDNFIDSPPILVHELVENYGLSVFVANFEDKGIAGYIDINKHWIVVNKDDHVSRQNFTIAHELGHWIMHRPNVDTDETIRIVYRKPIGGEVDPLEIQANAFAAHLLVPDQLLQKYTDRTESELAHLFNVSQSVIGFRRMNLHG